MSFQELLQDDKIYLPSDINEVLTIALKDVETVRKRKIKHSQLYGHYYNCPASFDIETSSFTVNDTKTAIMYEWTFGINGMVIIGRTWELFFNMLTYLSSKLGLSDTKRLIIYVHNLAYEFQFIRRWIKWTSTFSLSARKPIYALSELGIEFRCSLLLSGYNLATLGKQLQKYHVQKMVGDLDYTLIRNSLTPLTDKEIKYCVNDVKVVMAYIQEQIEQNDYNITKIPLTKTGYVRRFCRDAVFNDPGKKKSFKRLKYMDFIKHLTLTPDEYQQLKRAFAGGFTHASTFYSTKLLHNVCSYDFTSSYPAVMLSERFPMSNAEIIEIRSMAELEENLKYYCCLFDIELEGIESTILYENYISISHCWNTKNVQTNNGRVVRADKLSLTVTEQDFVIIRKFYKWKRIKIGVFRRYYKDYLPTDLVKAILDLYARKTTLKGVAGEEVRYLNGKEMLNSTYGMMVMDIVRAITTYDNVCGWSEQLPDLNKAIEEYNNSNNRFLFYPWGVWVTAYARRNLFTGIVNVGSDYVYSDTDSIKSIHPDAHSNYFSSYNQRIREQLYRSMDYHGLSHELVEPRTVKGIPKCIGLWDYEGIYTRFKTLGAKRYMTEDKEVVMNIGKHPLINRKLSLTVSGLNKTACIPYLRKKYRSNTDVFNHFNDGLYVEPEGTGKNIHTYLDEEMEGDITDYLGNTAHYHELSAVHLGPADYELSLKREYLDYLEGIIYSNET